jgi:uncharacterized protein
MTSGHNGSVVVRGVIFLIELYRHMVSPMRLPSCRFTPTCSQYAVDALSEYGLIHGGGLGMVRLLKCGPWHRGGWDPIPERDGAAQHKSEGVQAADHLWGSPVQQRAKGETRV